MGCFGSFKIHVQQKKGMHGLFGSFKIHVHVLKCDQNKDEHTGYSSVKD